MYPYLKTKYLVLKLIKVYKLNTTGDLLKYFPLVIIQMNKFSYNIDM